MYLKVLPDNRGLYTYGVAKYPNNDFVASPPSSSPLIMQLSATHQHSRMKRLRGEHAINDILRVRLLLRRYMYIGTPTRNYTSVER